MKQLLGVTCISFTLLLSSCADRATRDPAKLKDLLTPEFVGKHMFAIAGDATKGRSTPGPGLDSAASYIAGEFALWGVEPVSGSYYQKIPLTVLNLGSPNTLSLVKGGQESPFALKADFTPFDMTGNVEAQGPVVFLGYGIVAPEYSFDEYAGMDVKGKIVFVLRHEPGENDTSSVFLGKRPTKYSNVGEKVKIAIDHGALGVLVATDPLNHTLLTPRGYPWPTLSDFLPKDAVPTTLGEEDGKRVPVFHVGPKVIAQLFGSVEALKELEAAIDMNMKPRSFELPGVVAKLRSTTVARTTYTQNVVGLIRGSDPVLRNEIVVVGGHYDHLGVGRGVAAGQDSIYNGADDNASGTVAAMGVARVMAAAAAKPRRSVLVLAFAGEEMGLWGSRYYTDNPLFPLERTVGMINLDMVGRNSPDSLQVIGSGQSPDLARITRQQNALVGFQLLDIPAEGGSDHMNFERHGVPAVFYHSGLHKDYHQVTDNPDRINLEKLAKASQLAFLTAWQMANDTTHYKFIETAK
jgi:hypothetical protein